MEEHAFKNLVEMLYDTSLLASGFIQEDPSQFSKRIYNLISCGVGECDEEIIKHDTNEPLNDTIENEYSNMEQLD
jgi:hypothetical protein